MTLFNLCLLLLVTTHADWILEITFLMSCHLLSQSEVSAKVYSSFDSDPSTYPEIALFFLSS